jgi:TonB family protein
VLARQEIRSLPDAPDNSHQTIVTPPSLKLQHDVELPNLIEYKPALSARPLEAISRSAALRLTGLVPKAVAPEIMQIKPQRALPKAQPRLVQPAPELGSIRQGSPQNLAQLLPPIANPVLPVPVIVQSKPRRALPGVESSLVQPAPEAGSIRRGGATNLAQLLPPRAGAVPPAPRMSDAHMPQVLALNAHPADVPAPVPIPEGNRRGAFAASSAGRANATGTPGAESSSGTGKQDANTRVNAPAGISVGPSPSPTAAIAVPDGPSPKPGVANPELRSKLLAAMRTPAIASIPPRPPAARESTGASTELENHIFAGRRSYTLAVNMPNLNSATGSWIIHFADRDQGLVPSAITAPEVVSKFDPAYPGELIHDGVKGTVVLTAIIRADGSVSDIAVAKGLESQLDQNAVQALSRWVFRPALKNGRAIDLEAVITVPFRAKATGF